MGMSGNEVIVRITQSVNAMVTLALDRDGMACKHLVYTLQWDLCKQSRRCWFFDLILYARSSAHGDIKRLCSRSLWNFVQTFSVSGELRLWSLPGPDVKPNILPYYSRSSNQFGMDFIALNILIILTTFTWIILISHSGNCVSSIEQCCHKKPPAGPWTGLLFKQWIETFWCTCGELS